MDRRIKCCDISSEELKAKLKEEMENRAFVAYLEGELCETERDFLLQVAKIFRFPSYYGENWNAFDECICDLEWLDLSQYSRVLFVIDGFKKMFSRGLPDSHEALLRHLNWMFEGWDEEHIVGEVWLNS